MPETTTTREEWLVASPPRNGPLHLVKQDDRFSPTFCGIRPSHAWARVQRDLPMASERPEDLCRECWHNARFLDHFEQMLR